MAPEQLAGEAADGRSDLFSLGVILYAMVTGHSPFQGNSATTVCFKVANREPIAASALDMTLPPQLDALISRAMAKDPKDRYQRGSDLADDIRILRESLGVSSSTTSRLRTGTRTRSARTSSTAVRPAQVAAAGNAVQSLFAKARTRDLMLGAVTLILLVIVLIQSKLLVNLPKFDFGSSSAPTPLSAANVGASKPGSVDRDTPPRVVQSVPIPNTSAPKRAASKPPQHVAPKQIVIPLSTVDLAVQHQFKDATLYVWIDDKLELTLPLHGAAQKKLVVFNGIRGVVSQTLKVPAGKRVLRFRALSADQTVDLSKTLSADFVGGDTKSLTVSFEKKNSAMRLTWQ